LAYLPLPETLPRERLIIIIKATTMIMRKVTAAATGSIIFSIIGKMILFQNTIFADIILRLSQNFSFWNSNPGFKRKSGL
jgi:hypothetical protein